MGRKIDYSQDEMMELTGMTRSQFVRGLERVCEMYGFDITDFKVEKDNKDSAFFFPPEVADLLAILIRNLDKHPLKRKNAKIDTITGDNIQNYYQCVLEDIDDNVISEVEERIYCNEGHLGAQNISDWTAPFVKALSRFLDNITTLEKQDVGASLELFTKKLDEMNYCLFRGNYLMGAAYSSNVQHMKKYGVETDSYYDEIEEKLHRTNISIDWLIAEMIRWCIPGVIKVRDSGFPEYEVEDSEALRFLFGCGPDELTIDDYRTIYYRVEIHNKYDDATVRHNKAIMDHARGKNKQWKDTVCRIKEGTFAEPQEKTLEERIEIIKGNIASCEKELQTYKDMLEQLENQREEDPRSTFLQTLQEKYVEYCEKQDRENGDVEAVVNQFVGRAIYELLK
jgi:hypothetical protein